MVTVYPNRGSVPASLWHSLFDNASESIDVLAFAASFLHDTLPDVDELLIAKARAGVRVRLVFGDPDSEAVRIRGVEEGIGESLAERCRLTWKYLEPVLAEPEVSVRAHATTLYCSMFRFDDDLLANHHLLGAPANHSPVVHIRRLVGGRLFDHHLKSFERVWSSASEAPSLMVRLGRPRVPASADCSELTNARSTRPVIPCPGQLGRVDRAGFANGRPPSSAHAPRAKGQ